jgi:hypothetical protein
VFGKVDALSRRYARVPVSGNRLVHVRLIAASDLCALAAPDGLQARYLVRDWVHMIYGGHRWQSPEPPERQNMLSAAFSGRSTRAEGATARRSLPRMKCLLRVSVWN